MKNIFDKIEDALEDLKNGIPIIVVDNEDRENEGDFVLPAEKATEESIRFMVNEGRGLMCAPLIEERAKHLNLYPMASTNSDAYGTAFTVSVDSLEGTTTGISVGDRLKTILNLADDNKGEKDFRKPGHIFPLIAKAGGVLERIGHTEAAVDLAKLCNLKPVAVIIEILNQDGTMARRNDLFKLKNEKNIKLITIKDLIEYRKKHDKLVNKEVEARLPTKFGNFNITAYSDKIENKEYVILTKGDVKGKENVMVRLHSECLTGDIFGSKRCDCGEQLEKSLQLIEQKGNGILIYLRQEGRGIGLTNKLKAYNLQDKGFDTLEANHQLGFSGDLRDYAVAAQILKDLNIDTVNLVTNNPDKIKGLEKYGIKVSKIEKIEIPSNDFDKDYLKTKKEKMGHLLDQDL